VRWC